MKTLVLFSLAACGTDPTAPTPPPATHAITGAATFVTADEAGATTTFPIDLHETLMTAQFPLDDGFDIREGTARADGTFAIADAPDGDYWLETFDVPSGNRQYLWTDAATIAFEERGAGRGDAVAASQGTLLRFVVDGLDPVITGDTLAISSGNLGLTGNLFAPLQLGATTLDFPHAWNGQPLISAAKHDRLILTQERNRVDATSGLAYRTPVASVTFDDIEQQDGVETPAIGTLVPAPALDYHLRWTRSAFAAASRDANPAVGPVAGQDYVMRAEPGGATYGTSPFAPIVLSLLDVLAGATDLDLAFAVGNPYPADWLWADFAMAFPVTLPVPGIEGATLVDGAIIEVKTNDIASTVAPLVTPPRTPTIDGADGFADHDGVGLTPTIAWTAPAQGTPDAYVITVERWEVTLGNADLATVATLVVPADVTSVRVPARLLDSGQHYVLHVAALAQPGIDARTGSLYALSVPYGFAESITGTFSP